MRIIMNQSKLESAIETTLNVGSGFIIAMIIWFAIIQPVWDIEVTFMDNVGITAIFTIVSVARGYLWRRFFATGVHKLVVAIIRNTYAKYI